jgi:hypothetical protein
MSTLDVHVGHPSPPRATTVSEQVTSTARKIESGMKALAALGDPAGKNAQLSAAAANNLAEASDMLSTLLRTRFGVAVREEADIDGARAHIRSAHAIFAEFQRKIDDERIPRGAVQVVADGSSTLERAAATVAAAAQRTGKPHYQLFNNINLIAMPGQPAAQIIGLWTAATRLRNPIGDPGHQFDIRKNDAAKQSHQSRPLVDVLRSLEEIVAREKDGPLFVVATEELKHPQEIADFVEHFLRLALDDNARRIVAENLLFAVNRFAAEGTRASWKNVLATHE